MKLRVHETGGTTYRTQAGALLFPGDYVVGDEVSAEDAAQVVADGRGEMIEDQPAKKSKAKVDDHLE